MIGGNKDSHFKYWSKGLPAWPKPLHFDKIYTFLMGYYTEDLIELLFREK